VFNLLATVGYRFNHTLGLDPGYRYLGIDFKDGSFIYDVSMYGVVIGLGISF
jgi:hypothetical protein